MLTNPQPVLLSLGSNQHCHTAGHHDEASAAYNYNQNWQQLGPGTAQVGEGLHSRTGCTLFL
jgi:hypothetical protein